LWGASITEGSGDGQYTNERLICVNSDYESIDSFTETRITAVTVHEAAHKRINRLTAEGSLHPDYRKNQSLNERFALIMEAKFLKALLQDTAFAAIHEQGNAYLLLVEREIETYNAELNRPPGDRALFPKGTQERR
jgi:hypothetical protein